MSEKFCLKWNEFESNVSKSFSLLRNEEYLHDVTLVCDDNSQVSAHKLVLSACSEYFKTLFRNNIQASPLVCLGGISEPELNSILDYMYNGEAKIFQENLENFLSVAQRFKVLGLLQNEENKSCAETLIAEQQTFDSNPDPDNTFKGDTNNISMYDSQNTIVKNSFRARKPGKISDHQEIDRKVDEYIEICSDGKMKCLYCGKLDQGKSTSGKFNLRSHVELHLEDIAYQCPFCEKTFRSRNAFGHHKSKQHK